MKKTLLLTALIGTFVSSQLFAQSASKNVVIEEFTGAWCGWCTDGAEIVDNLTTDHPTRVFSAAIHNGDDMVIPENSQLETFGMPGGKSWPSGMINRKKFQGDLTPYRRPITGSKGWVAIAADEMNEMVVLSVDVSASNDNGQVDIEVGVNFNAGVAADMSIIVLVTENDVTSSNAQQNYLSGKAGYEDTYYYTQPSVLPNYKHQWVLRDVLPDLNGNQDAIPNPAVKGESYNASFSYQVQSGEDVKNMHVVAMVVSGTNSEIINSNQTGINPVGIEEKSNVSINSISPNPISELGLVKFNLERAGNTKVELVSITGQTVAVLKQGNMVSGNHHAAIDATEIQNGVYFVVVTSESTRSVQRVVISK